MADPGGVNMQNVFHGAVEHVTNKVSLNKALLRDVSGLRTICFPRKVPASAVPWVRTVLDESTLD